MPNIISSFAPLGRCTGRYNPADGNTTFHFHQEITWQNSKYLITIPDSAFKPRPSKTALVNPATMAKALAAKRRRDKLVECASMARFDKQYCKERPNPHFQIDAFNVEIGFTVDTDSLGPGRNFCVQAWIIPLGEDRLKRLHQELQNRCMPGFNSSTKQSKPANITRSREVMQSKS